MAKRSNQSLSLLKMRLINPFLWFLVFSILGFLLVSNSLFEKLRDEQTEAVSSVIGTLVRSESALSQSYLISQSLEDLQVTGIVECAELIQIKADRETIFYSSVFKNSCKPEKLTKTILNGIDGHAWVLKTVVHFSFIFRLLEWITAISGSVLILMIMLGIRHVSAKNTEKVLALENRRRLLEDITRQVQHDAASPLMALRSIASSASLDNDTKQFLLQVISRTNGIFETLKKSELKFEKFSIEKELVNLIHEKRVTGTDFPIVRFEIHDFNIFMPKIEFGRIVSNLLNNAKEANCSEILIATESSPTHNLLIFQDDGKNFEPSIINKIGVMRFSYGKESGTGLGLFHAFKTMALIGGRAEISVEPVKKITLLFPSNI